MIADLDQAPKERVEKPVWRVAFFGRLEERKGIKLFVDAVQVRAHGRICSHTAYTRSLSLSMGRRDARTCLHMLPHGPFIVEWYNGLWRQFCCKVIAREDFMQMY